MSENRVAIIGTREPDAMQRTSAFELAEMLTSQDYRYRVRTGGAFGVDHAAMNGSIAERLDVVLPWAQYNHRIIPNGATVIVFDRARDAQWLESVTALHPAAARLPRAVVALHARNYGIVESSILVIAMPGEKNGGGGTMQGIRVANSLHIPVIQVNYGYLQFPDRLIIQVMKFLAQREAAQRRKGGAWSAAAMPQWT